VPGSETTQEGGAALEPEPPARGRLAGRLTLSCVVGLAFVLLGAVVGVGAFRDNSFLTHLATGRLIIEDGGLPSSDVYSFTARGEPWVVQSWLISVVTAQLEAWGGLALVRAFFAVATATLAGITWLLAAPARTLVVRMGLAALVALLGAAGFWPERPLLFGLVGLGLVLLAAEDRFDPRWLVPVLWLWANAHGSFPMGFGVAVLLWAGRRLDGGDTSVERRVTLWVAVGMAAAVVGPLGPKVLTFPIELLSRQDVLSQVVEWQAPTFESAGQRLFLVFVLVCVLALVRRPSWRAALPFVVFLGLALVAARNDAPAALVFLPGAAYGLADLGRATILGDRTSPVLRIVGVALAALVLLVVVSPLLSSGAQTDADELVGGPDLDLSGYPVAALSWLDQQGVLGPDTRLVARDYVGNYLEAATDGEVPVFVDDRFDMYPDVVLEDHVQLLGGAPGERGSPIDVIESYDADVVVWEAGSATGELLALSDRWAVVYVDDAWLVACPRVEPGGEARCGPVDA
jgi:hypothetical protein